MAASHRFRKPLWDAFQQAFQDDAALHEAEYLVDCITDAMFDSVDLTVQPASKQEVFAEFTEPFEDEEPRTVEMAEAALALLAERQLVVVEGDQITLHPRLTGAVTIQPAEPE